MVFLLWCKGLGKEMVTNSQHCEEWEWRKSHLVLPLLSGFKQLDRCSLLLCLIISLLCHTILCSVLVPTNNVHAFFKTPLSPNHSTQSLTLYQCAGSSTFYFLFKLVLDNTNHTQIHNFTDFYIEELNLQLSTLHWRGNGAVDLIIFQDFITCNFP
jgi:hypothetical protein